MQQPFHKVVPFSLSLKKQLCEDLSPGDHCWLSPSVFTRVAAWHGEEVKAAKGEIILPRKEVKCG